jgi:hypothetical protein
MGNNWDMLYRLGYMLTQARATALSSYYKYSVSQRTM